jgi:hypothetical protein
VSAQRSDPKRRGVRHVCHGRQRLRYAGDVGTDTMLALGSGVLFFGFLVLVIALVAYAAYFLFFRLGK